VPSTPFARNGPFLLNAGIRPKSDFIAHDLPRVVLKFEDVLAFWSIGWGEQTAFFFPPFGNVKVNALLFRIPQFFILFFALVGEFSPLQFVGQFSIRSFQRPDWEKKAEILES
jgi:hypothetical protein